MISRLGHLFAQLRAVFDDPQANPQITVLFIAVGAVMLLIVVAVFLVLMTVSEEPRRERRRRHVAPGLLALGLFAFVVGAYAAANEVATSPIVCARCHELQEAVRTWGESDHRTADCLQCHQGPGISGHVITRLTASVNLLLHYRTGGSLPTSDISITNDGCLGCHAEVAQGTVTTPTLKVRHSDFLERGVRCTSCHGGAGHGERPGSAVPSMDACVSCHDGTLASNTCDLCHVSDIAASREIPKDYPRTQLGPPTTCEGCHPLDTCRECHGVEMPHSAAFVEGGHAREAAFEKKEGICLRCHTLGTCAECHTGADLATVPWGHVPTWKTDHQRGASASCAGCHKTQNMCALCHD